MNDFFNRIQAQVPLILFTAFGLIRVLLTIFKMSVLTGTIRTAAAVLVGIYIFWLISELPVAAGEATERVPEVNRYSLYSKHSPAHSGLWRKA